MTKQKRITSAIVLLGSSILYGCLPTFNIKQPQGEASPQIVVPLQTISKPTTTQQPAVENQSTSQVTNKSDAINQLHSTKQCPGCDLEGVDLEKADLSSANLSNANLTQTDLEKANLTNANLSGANLTNAELEGANLIGANLRNTNFTNVDLEDVNFTGADVRGANFTGAKLEGAIGLSR